MTCSTAIFIGSVDAEIRISGAKIDAFLPFFKEIVGVSHKKAGAHFRRFSQNLFISIRQDRDTRILFAHIEGFLGREGDVDLWVCDF